MRQHHLRRRMPVSPLSTALSPLGTTSSDNSEETPADHSILSTEERTVVRHFESNHSRSKEGRFVVLLPRNPSAKQIGESRSQAVRRFLSLERSLTAKGRFKELDDVMQEYLDLGHAEPISSTDLERPIEDVQGYKHYHTSQSSVQQNRLLEYP
jgi:hypothetical protein